MIRKEGHDFNLEVFQNTKRTNGLRLGLNVKTLDIDDRGYSFVSSIYKAVSRKKQIFNYVFIDLERIYGNIPRGTIGINEEDSSYQIY